MDGLLIDSEDQFTKCTNEILAKYGKGPIPWSVKSKLQGRPGTAAMEIFLKVGVLKIISPAHFQFCDSPFFVSQVRCAVQHSLPNGRA
jgi:hypothetical protein